MRCASEERWRCRATGLAGLTFLRRGQVVLEEAYISVYGGYATRLLRLQLDLIQALDKHRPLGRE